MTFKVNNKNSTKSKTYANNANKRFQGPQSIQETQLPSRSTKPTKKMKGPSRNL